MPTKRQRKRGGCRPGAGRPRTPAVRIEVLTLANLMATSGASAGDVHGLRQRAALALLSLGADMAELAAVLDLPTAWCAEAFAAEAERARLVTLANVGANLYASATGRAGRRYSVAAAIFWLRTRGRSNGRRAR